MKTMIRLVALVLVVLASLATLPLAAQTYQPLGPKSCAQFCMIALCAYPQTCGPFVDSTGTPRCGCHGEIGTVE
jgi:hypothetical protein